MPTPHLLLHLPEKGNHLESSPQLIEAYRSLIEEQDYVWLCKPGSPLDPLPLQELVEALQRDAEVFVFLFVRLSLDERRMAFYRARLRDMRGPGKHKDKEHILLRFRRRSCGTWLKLTDLEPIAAEQIHRLHDFQTDQPVPIWTDLRTDLYLVREGEPQAVPHQETSYSYWLLCLSQARAKAEFKRSWRFRPIATYQPGSAEFIAEHETDTPQQVLLYDRVFGGPTYLTILGIYEVVELIPQGTSAGALLYAAQLRQVASFAQRPQLDPRRDAGLWSQLEIAKQSSDWEALVSQERVLLPLTEKDYQQILTQTGDSVALANQHAAELPATTGYVQNVPAVLESKGPDLAESLAELEAITAKPLQDVTEVECYHLLRALERALRVFIDHELSQVSRDWWEAGRLPQESRTLAEERKQQREHPFPWQSQQDLPVREYLNFSDYVEIITMARNWNEVFKSIFVRQEVIRGKLIELGILRNDIAHMRELKPAEKETFITIGRHLLSTIHDRINTRARPQTTRDS